MSLDINKLSNQMNRRDMLKTSACASFGALALDSPIKMFAGEHISQIKHETFQGHIYSAFARKQSGVTGAIVEAAARATNYYSSAINNMLPVHLKDGVVTQWVLYKHFEKLAAKNPVLKNGNVGEEQVEQIKSELISLPIKELEKQVRPKIIKAIQVKKIRKAKEAKAQKELEEKKIEEWKRVEKERFIKEQMMIAQNRYLLASLYNLARNRLLQADVSELTLEKIFDNGEIEVPVFARHWETDDLFPFSESFEKELS